MHLRCKPLFSCKFPVSKRSKCGHSK